MKLSQFIGGDSLKEHLKSTRDSQFVKATGRNVKPAWANRFEKDFYDLEYDVPSSLNKMGSKFVKNDPSRLNRSTKEAKDKRYAIDYYSEILSKRKNYKEKVSFLDIRNANPERINLSPTKEQRQALGLCPFEYDNTIQGRIQRRSNHHLSYEKNKVNRILNENPVYYSRNESIDLGNSRLSEEKRKLKMYHPFGSYTQRRTFEPRDELDKIFDTDAGHRATSPRKSPESIRKFETVLRRVEPKLSESVDLSYEILPAIGQLKKKSISYPIGSEEREIQFSPQIISERRGCYR